MEISIQVGIKVSETEKYDMSLNIPGTAPSADNPFHFIVQQNNGGTPDCVMQIAFADEKHIYLEVEPPKSILEKAKVDQYVDNLKAIVKEGNYDSESGKFLEKSDSES